MTLADCKKRAKQIRDQVLKTWKPPAQGIGGPAGVAQTSAMVALHWVVPNLFEDIELSANQSKALREGIAEFERAFNG